MITIVQSLSDKQETADSTPTITLGDAPADGNLVGCLIWAQQQGGDVTITQPSGFTVPPTNGNSSNSGDVASQISWVVASGMSATISGSLSASRVWGIAVIEVHDDLGGTWTYDKSTKNATGSGTNATTGTMATTTKADEFILASIGIAKQATPSSPQNGFTLQEKQIASASGGNLISGALLYRIVSAIGAYGTGVTLNTGRNWTGHIVSFYVTAPLAVNTVAPVVSGTAEVDNTLSSTTGTWTGTSMPSSYVYQWQRDNEGGGAYVNIAGANDATYTLVDADDGCNVRCQVSAVNAGGTSDPVNSNTVGPVITVAPTNVTLPEIAGAASRTLAVSTGTWTGMRGSIALFAYEWEISANGTTGWTTITGDSEHGITDAEVGKYVRATVTATNSGGSTSATSEAFGPLISTELSFTVEMAFGSGPGTEDPIWTDITSYVHGLSWNRGRQNEQNQMAAGTGSMLISDDNSDFDPRNPDSVFFPDVRPGTPVRAYLQIGYGTYPLFHMTTERQPRTLRIGNVYTERQIDMVDGFAILANAGISGNSFLMESSDSRVNSVLDAINWAASKRGIGDGASTLPAIIFDDDAGVSAQQHLLTVNDSENGLFFCDGNGDIRFVGRHELIQQAGFTTSRATFADAGSIPLASGEGLGYGEGGYGEGGYGSAPPGTAFPYIELEPSFDVDLVINKVVVTRQGGTPQVAEDLVSQEQYFIREKQFTSAVATDAEALNQGQWKLGQFAQPLDRVESITGQPLIDPSDGDQMDAWLPREVGDRITVLETPPGFAAVQSNDYTIQHLEGSITRGPLQGFKLKFLLWPAATTSFWAAGDAELSLAGVTTKPGY